MDKFTFETILKCIKVGAPVFAEELTESFIKLVESEATLRKRLESMSYDCSCEKSKGKEEN